MKDRRQEPSSENRSGRRRYTRSFIVDGGSPVKTVKSLARSPTSHLAVQPGAWMYSPKPGVNGGASPRKPLGRAERKDP